MFGERGDNTLGVILEKVRLSIVDESEIEDWLRSTVKLADIEDLQILPVIEIDVFKNDEHI